jgi:hypothetical protein
MLHITVEVSNDNQDEETSHEVQIILIAGDEHYIVLQETLDDKKGLTFEGPSGQYQVYLLTLDGDGFLLRMNSEQVHLKQGVEHDLTIQL